MYLWLKYVHAGSALLSIGLFFLRGYWFVGRQTRPPFKLLRILPHIVDTVLLVSAIALSITLQLYPLEHPWLAAKVVLLLAYIGLGLVAFRFARSRGARLAAWLAAIVVFVVIVASAVMKPGM